LLKFIFTLADIATIATKIKISKDFVESFVKGFTQSPYYTPLPGFK
jgi:hypothetical protein